jgi:hypothetical protein
VLDVATGARQLRTTVELREWAALFNAFKKLPTLAMSAAWPPQMEQTAKRCWFYRHPQRVEFETWVQRMRSKYATAARLKEMPLT